MVIPHSAIDLASDWSRQDSGADTTRCTHVHQTLFLAVIRGCGLRDYVKYRVFPAQHSIVNNMHMGITARGIWSCAEEKYGEHIR